MDLIQSDLNFLAGFLEKYENAEAPVFLQLDPMTGLSKAFNNLQTLVEDRTDLAEPLQNLMYALMQAGGA